MVVVLVNRIPLKADVTFCVKIKNELFLSINRDHFNGNNN